MTVRVDWKKKILFDKDGNEHKMYPHEFWYSVPSRTSWEPWEGPVNPLSFAFALHNAGNGEGILPSMATLLTGIPPKEPKRNAASKITEQVFEEIRSKFYPDQPSRLRCHFLSLSKNHAKKRMEEWGWSYRSLVRCYLILSQGKYHYADITAYETYASGNTDESFVHQYWKSFSDQFPLDQVEVLADSALYFPDWQLFPKIDMEALKRYSQSVLKK